MLQWNCRGDSKTYDFPHVPVKKGPRRVNWTCEMLMSTQKSHHITTIFSPRSIIFVYAMKDIALW